MSKDSTIQLNSPHIPNTIKEKSQNGCCSSLVSHLIGSVALGIIVGAAAAYGAYYFTHSLDMWTAINGGGPALVTALVSFAIMRCASDKKEDAKPQSPNDQPSASGVNGAKPNSATSANNSVKHQKSFFKQGENKVLQKDLETILLEITSVDFTKIQRLKDVTLTDPTNNLPLSFAYLYQALIPIAGEKSSLIEQLLAQELDTIAESQDPNKEATIKKHIKYFDKETILRISKFMRNSTSLQGYETLEENAVKESIAKRQALEMQLSQSEWKEQWFFGVTQDDGSCFFHTMAQYLTYHTGKVVTEAQLRHQCRNYMESVVHQKGRTNTNGSLWVNLILRDEEWQKEFDQIERSSFICQQKNKLQTQDQVTPSWGRWDLHGQMIAELYGIELVVIEAQVMTIIETDYADAIDNNEDDDDDSSMGEFAAEIEHKNNPTLGDIEVKTTNKTFEPFVSDQILKGVKPYGGLGALFAPLNLHEKCENKKVIVACDGRHFFPVWIKEKK